MKKVDYREVLAESEEGAVCACDICEEVYKIRPFLCKCKSNVFLKNIKENVELTLVELTDYKQEVRKEAVKKQIKKKHINL